jgi:hypothetical protein
VKTETKRRSQECDCGVRVKEKGEIKSIRIKAWKIRSNGVFNFIKKKTPMVFEGFEHTVTNSFPFLLVYIFDCRLK